MATNDTSTATFHRTSNRQQIVVSPVKNKCKSLMGYTKETSGSCDAPARLFQSSTDEATFITKDFGIERKAWRQRHFGGCGCCLVGFIKCDRKNTPGALAQPGIQAKVLGV